MPFDKDRVLGIEERIKIRQQQKVLRDRIIELEKKKNGNGDSDGAITKERNDLIQVSKNIDKVLKDDTFKDFAETLNLPIGHYAMAKYKKSKDDAFDMSPITGFAEETLPTLAMGSILGALISGASFMSALPMMAVVCIAGIIVTPLLKSIEIGNRKDKDKKPLEDIKELKESTEKTTELLLDKRAKVKQQSSEFDLIKKLTSNEPKPD